MIDLSGFYTFIVLNEKTNGSEFKSEPVAYLTSQTS